MAGDAASRKATARERLTTFAFMAALALAAYVALAATLYFGQEKLIFPASTLDPNYKFAFDQPFEELRIDVPGAKLDALHFRQPSPRGLVFFLHGNGGDLSSWATGIDFYQRVNFDLFIFDYRGYGRSTGRIESEAQLHEDIRIIWDAVAPGYRARNLPIVIYGRSLGAGLAVPLARDVEPALLVLATPFVSLAQTARRVYPFVPQWLLKYPLRTDLVIGEVRAPILFVHGTRDELIPFEDSEALMKQVRSSAELMRVEGAGHNDIHTFPSYLDGLAHRLNQVGTR